ncbi:MAG: hypothetical protein JXM70_01350 [Pirellulales bacterium]|nr:hypothetical protein [Pirellulales bacterium]
MAFTSYVRTILLLVVLCLGCMLALHTVCFTVEERKKIDFSATFEKLAPLEGSAALTAITDKTGGEVLSDAKAPQWRIVSERFSKRLTVVVKEEYSPPLASLLSTHRPATNWVSSYLPDQEFGTVLSRFIL